MWSVCQTKRCSRLTYMRMHDEWLFCLSLSPAVTYRTYGRTKLNVWCRYMVAALPRVRRICMNAAAVRVSACWTYDCVLACGFWSTKVHVVFQFAEPSWNISPGKPASCSSLARLLAAAMFRVFYMFSHAWPSLQSWSAAGAMVASWVQLHWCHLPPGVVCEAWAWEVQALRLLQRTTPTCSRCPSMSWSTLAIGLGLGFRVRVSVSYVIWSYTSHLITDISSNTKT